MMSSKINICGIGPGHPSLILPQVFILVADSDVVVGGSRQLSIFNLDKKRVLKMRTNIHEMVEEIKQLENKMITVLVSGDTGFHSLLRSFLTYFSPSQINVVPGISSYQYLFAKIGMTYETAWIGSLHGQDIDFIDKVKNNRTVFLLTDAKNSWKQIASRLCANQLGECTMYIGNRLSYDDETILTTTAQETMNNEGQFDLCAVIVINHKIANDE